MSTVSQDLNRAPEDEQKICVSCGFCCDATVFLDAHIKLEELGKIPKKMEETLFLEKDEYYFVQPCPYFDVKCTIYDQQRAEICGTYRCQLLKDFASGKINLDEAMTVVADAKILRDGIIKDFGNLTGIYEPVIFRQLPAYLHKTLKFEGADAGLRMEMEMLQARCNIFEALLIKHFRSRDEFEKMIMK